MKARLGDYISEYTVRNKADENIPVYSVTNSQGFCRGYFDKEVASKDKTTYKIVPRGCFAYNPSRINVGSVDWLRNEDRVIVSPLYNVFSVTSKLDQQYLYYYLKSDITLYFIKALATGSVRDNLKLQMLYEFPINLPSLEKQKQIAIILDKLSSVISLRHKQIQTLDDLIKARFVEMFGDPLSIKPKWEKRTFGDEFFITSGGTPSTAESSYWNNGTISWIGSNMCQDQILFTNDGKFITEDGLKNSSAKIFKTGTVLVALVGATIGKTALLKFDTATNQNIAAIDVNGNPFFTSEFVFYELQMLYNKFQEIGNGKFKMANQGFIRGLPIVMAPFDLQKHFATFVTQVDKSKVVVQKALDEAQLLFDSLMQQYFG